MGSGRDKRKKAKPKKPGQGADKTTRKTEANEDKATRRSERRTKAGLRLSEVLALSLRLS